MTSNRACKAETRAHQASTGSRYVLALRETEPPTLAEVMQQHPQLTSEGTGIGAFGQSSAIRSNMSKARTCCLG